MIRKTYRIMYITPAKSVTFVHYNVTMEAKEIINYKALSQLLTKNDNSIRKGRVPNKYKDQFAELEALLNYFIHKHKR